MKRLFLATVLLGLFGGIASFALAYQSPGKATGLVNDFAGILTTEQRTTLENKVGNYARPAGVQIAVVTVKSLGGDTIENFAQKLFAEWGIGNALKDNGLLLLVAPVERELRIEVGYGLEPSVTDAMSSTIIRNIITPAFRTGDYYGGIDGGLTAIMGLIDQDPEMIQAVTDAGTDNLSDRVSQFFPLIFFFFVVGLNLLGVMARTKSWWLGGVLGFILGFIFASIWGGLICAFIGFVVDFVLSRYGKNWFKGPHGPNGSNGPWFIGGFGGGHGGGFGGFGGFGGGGSGGGGSSGRW